MPTRIKGGPTIIKVFQVIECGGPGGSGRQVAELCNSLPAEFETTLVYSVRPGTTPEAYRAEAKGAAEAFYIPEMTREISPGRDLTAFLKLRRLFIDEKPDVVHAHCAKAGVLARLAARSAGVPRVFYSPRGYSFQMTDRGASSRALYRLAERSVSGIGEIVAVSASEAELARELTSRPVHIVSDPYNGPLPEADGEAKEGLLVGACGRLTPARRPEAFVRLAQQLTDSRNGLRCVWIGDGEMAPLVREMIRDMNLSHRLEVTGWLEPGAVRDRLKGLDVFVHFSRWEGLPNAVIEAMAAGLPVVASDIPGNRDAVGDGENGLLAKDEVELLEKTLKLVDDAALRRRLGEAGRRRVETDFRPAKTLEALCRLYRGSR